MTQYTRKNGTSGFDFMNASEEPAYEVTFESFRIRDRIVTVNFEQPIPCVQKGDGLVHIGDTVIEEPNGGRTFEEGISHAMTDVSDVIPFTVRYRGQHNEWYVAECELTRNVLTRGTGISVRTVRRRSIAPPKT